MSALPFDSADPADLFEVLSKLGEGSYGSVYKALDKRDGKLVAIKVLEVENEDTVELQKEINILKECDCEWIVRYKGSYRKDGNIWIVMEFCGAGSLCDLMAITERTLNEEQIAIVMRESLHGLEYLHAKRKIHRDIKSGNILISHAGDCKLADFGVSAELATTMSKRKTVIGTPYWMAPEVLQSTEYNGKADIWSLAITAIELAVGEPPHSNVHPMRCLAPEVPVQMADGKTKPASLVRAGDLLAGTHGPVAVLRAPRDGEALPTTETMYAVQYQLPTGEMLPPFKVNAAHELTFRVARPMQQLEQGKFRAFDATATPMQPFEFGVAPPAEGASEADAEAAMWHAYLDAADSGSSDACRAAPFGTVFERTAAELHKMLEHPGQADAVAEWAGGIYRAPGAPVDAPVLPRPFVVGATHAASAAKVLGLAAATAADGAVLPELEVLLQPAGCAPLRAGDAARLVLCLSSPPAAADAALLTTLRQALSEAGLEVTPESGVVATALPAGQEQEVPELSDAARAGMVHILGELRPQRILAMGAAARAQWSRVAALEGVSAARTSVALDGSLVTSFTYTPSAARSSSTASSAAAVGEDEEKKCDDQSCAFEVQVHHVRDPRSAPVSVLAASLRAALCPSSSTHTQVARLHSITLLRRPGQEFVPMEVGGDRRYQLGVGVTTHNSIFIIPNSDPPTLPDPSKWSADFNDFLKVCLVKNPDKRPTATELLATHPFILKAKSKAIIAQLVDECMQEIDEYRAQEAAEAANAAANPPPEGEAGQENAAGGTMSSSYSSGTMVNTGTMVHNGNDTGTMRSPASYEAGTMVFNQGTMMQAAAAHATAGMAPGDSGTMVLHATTPNNAGSKAAVDAAAAASAAAGAGVGGAARAKYEEPSYMRHIREASSKYGAKSGTGMGTGTASGSASQTGTMLSAAGGSAAAAAAPAPVTAADFREPLYRAQRRYDAGQLESLSVADLKASIAQLEKGLSAEKSQLEALYSEQKKQLKLAIEKKEKKK